MDLVYFHGVMDHVQLQRDSSVVKIITLATSRAPPSFHTAFCCQETRVDLTPLVPVGSLHLKRSESSESQSWLRCVCVCVCVHKHKLVQTRSGSRSSDAEQSKNSAL